MRNRIASIFSILFVLTCAGHTADYRALEQSIANARTPAERAAALRQVQSAAASDTQLSDAARNAQSSGDDRQAVKTIQRMLAARNEAQQSQASVPPAPDLAQKATAIKTNPLYKDTGTGQTSNWIQKTLARLGELIPKAQETQTPQIQGGSWIGNAFLIAVIAVLAAAIAAFLVYLFRHVSWQRAQKRRASAMLEEDEPSRTADEWLDLANALTAQGRFREAVRCLYLACLLRFDEAQVARFDRRQTNWEHLARIQASLRRPEHLDFLPPTQLFDQVWYGHRVRGVEDVDQFRAWYREVLDGLRAARAA